MKIFIVTGKYSSKNSLKPPGTGVPIHESTVKAISIDEYVAQRKFIRIDLMKLDAEGGELEAFRGAQETLRSMCPVIICEVLDWLLRPWEYPAFEIISCLREEGYIWFDFDDDVTISADEIRSEYPKIRNYLAVLREKLPLVSRWRRE